MLKIFIPAGEAKPIPPLGVIFGQHQLPSQKICLEFNKLTANIHAGVPVATRIIKKSQDFSMFIGNPSISFFIGNSVLVGVVSVESLFDIFKILKILYPAKSQDVIIKLLFTNLQSFGSKIKI